MKVKSESEVAQLCPTLSDPMDCSLPGSSIHGIFQERVLEWGVTAFSGLPEAGVPKYPKNAYVRAKLLQVSPVIKSVYSLHMNPSFHNCQL